MLSRSPLEGLLNNPAASTGHSKPNVQILDISTNISPLLEAVPTKGMKILYQRLKREKCQDILSPKIKIKLIKLLNIEFNPGEAIQWTEMSHKDPKPPYNAKLLQQDKVLVFSSSRARRLISPAREASDFRLID